MGLYGLAFALFLASLVGAGAVGYSKGSASRNAEISEIRASLAISRDAALRSAAKAEKAAGTVRVEYRDRIRTITQETAARVELVEVIKREIDPKCSLPANFRFLWDGEPAPGSATAQDSPGTDVPLGDLAETAAEARKRFETNRAKLDSLQSYLKAVQ